MVERTVKSLPARGKITRMRAIATATALRESGELSGVYGGKIRIKDTASGRSVIAFHTGAKRKAKKKTAKKKTKKGARIRRAAKKKR